VKVAVYGVAGRMGRRIASLLLGGAEGATLAGAIDSAAGSDVGELLGRPATGVVVSNDIEAVAKDVDVFIDFSTPEASLELAKVAAETKTPLVVGTTGFTPSQLEELNKITKDIPFLLAPNMSLGVNLLSSLVKQAAKSLPSEFQIEIVESHHAKKEDAPSGTALFLGAAAAEGRGVNFESKKRFSRDGQIGERAPDEIGIQSLRGGDVVGDHTVFFYGPGERIEITHKATNRDIFASGSIKAATWLAAQQPGSYTMFDVLGLKE